MQRSILYVSLAALCAMTFAEQAQASRSEATTTARHGVVRCGGNNWLRLSGTEIHFTSYVLRNFDSTQPIDIDRIRLWDATGAVLFDSAAGGLPPAENGILGPTNNTLSPNQTVQFQSNQIVPFLAQTNRPIQFEVEWSASKPALSLDAVTVRISRQRDPVTGEVLAERGRHAVECRSIMLR